MKKNATKVSKLQITIITALILTILSLLVWLMPTRTDYLKYAGIGLAVAMLLFLISQIRKQKKQRQWFTHITGAIFGTALYVILFFIAIPYTLTYAPKSEVQRETLLARIEGFAQKRTFYAVITHTNRDGTTAPTRLTIKGRNPRIYKTYRQLMANSVLKTMTLATVTSEDADIFTRVLPFSPTGMVRSGMHYAKTRVIRGGSTIPQQLARWVIKRKRTGTAIVKLSRKMHELFAAYQIMRIAKDTAAKRTAQGESITWRQQLIEWYMNLMPARGTGRGAIDACNGNFGHVCKTAMEAVYTGVNNPKSPNNYCPYRGKRFRQKGCKRAIIVARRMVALGYISSATYKSEIATCVTDDTLSYARPPVKDYGNKETQLVRLLKTRLRETEVRYNGAKRTLYWYGKNGIVVQTTIEPYAQTTLNKAVRNIVNEAHKTLYGTQAQPKEDEQITASAIIVQHGQIIAMSTNKTKYNFFTKHTLSPGSIAKTAVYWTWALLNPEADENMPIDNTQESVQWKADANTYQTWHVRRDHPPHDVCEAKDCFKNSENLAAVQLLTTLLRGSTKEQYTESLKAAVAYWLWWYINEARKSGKTRSTPYLWISKKLDVSIPTNWNTQTFKQQNEHLQQYAQNILTEPMLLRKLWFMLVSTRGATQLNSKKVITSILQLKLYQLYKSDKEKSKSALVYTPTLKARVERKIQEAEQLYAKHARELTDLPRGITMPETQVNLTQHVMNKLFRSIKKYATLTRKELFQLKYVKRNFNVWKQRLAHCAEFEPRWEALEKELKQQRTNFSDVVVENLMHDSLWNLHINTWLVGYYFALASGKPFKPTPAKVTLGAEEFTLVQMARAYSMFYTGKLYNTIRIMDRVKTLGKPGKVLYQAGTNAESVPLSYKQKTLMRAFWQATVHNYGTAGNIAKLVPAYVGGKTGTAQGYFYASFASIVGEGAVMIVSIYHRYIKERLRHKIQGSFAAKCVGEFFRLGGNDIISAPEQLAEPKPEVDQSTQGDIYPQREEDKGDTQQD